MNEEKNLNEEAVEETVEETVVEPVEAEAEVVAEVIEEAAEENAVEEVAAEVAEDEEMAALALESVLETAMFDDAEKTDEKKPFPVKGVIISAVIAVLVIALIVIGIVFGPGLFNKYNKAGYVDVSGRTVAEVADGAGMELAEFLEEYSLPANMPANTSESAAYYTIPCSKMAEMYGMDFATLKSTLQFPDTITEESTWGEAEGEVRLSIYVGEDNLEAFKETYGLGDEITGDTQWKEIRNIVDEFNRQQRIESEKAAKEAANSTVETEAEPVEEVAVEESVEAEAETETAETPAE